MAQLALLGQRNGKLRGQHLAHAPQHGGRSHHNMEDGTLASHPPQASQILRERTGHGRQYVGLIQQQQEFHSLYLNASEQPICKGKQIGRGQQLGTEEMLPMVSLVVKLSSQYLKQAVCRAARGLQIQKQTRTSLLDPDLLHSV